MSRIRALAGDTVLYGLGNILPRTIGFFLIILYTSTFDSAEYGVFTYISAFLVFVNIIFTFGMETSFFRFSTKPDADPQKVFNQVETIVIAISLPLSLLFIVLAVPISRSLDIPAHPEFIVWIAIGAFIEAVVAIPFAQLRLKKRPLKYAVARILNIIVVIVLNYWFLKINYNPAIGIGYIFIATVLANSLYLLFFIEDLLRWRPIFDKHLSDALLRYGWPVMVGGLAYAINEMFSRTMLKFWLPNDFYGPDSRIRAVGIFGAAYRFVTLMNLAVQAFRFAAEPFFFSNAADKNSPQLFARVNHYFIIVCCMLLLGVCLNIDVLKFFLRRPEYWSGLEIVPILLLASLFLGVYYNFSVWYKLTDKTYYGTIIFSGGALLTIILNYLLIPVWGYMGSAWTTLMVYFLMASTCYGIGQRYYPIPYKIISDSIYIIVTMTIIYVAGRITFDSQATAFIFHNGVILIFLGAALIVERTLSGKAVSLS